MKLTVYRSTWRGLSRTISGGALAIAVLASAQVASTALAQQNGGEKAPPREAKTLLAFEFAGMPSMLVSEKDAELARAMGMLPARVEELRGQVPEFNQAPPAATNLLFAILGSPVRMSVTDKGFDPDTGMPGLGAVLSFRMQDEKSAAAMADSVRAIQDMAMPGAAPKDSTRWPGMKEMPLPFGVVSYGPRKAADGSRYEVIFGAVDNSDTPFAALPAAGQISNPIVRAKLDLAAMTPFTQMLTGFLMMAGGPAGADAAKQMTSRGLMGPNAVSYELTKGYTANAGAAVMRVRGMANFAEASGLSTSPLSAADLATIPADASAAMLFKTPLASMWQQLRTQIEVVQPGHVDQVLAQIKSMTEVDVEQDIIAALGDTVAMYTSDSTGGGSILSGVAMLSLAQPDRLHAAIAKLAGKLNELSADQIQAPGAIRMEMFDHAGAKFVQLRFRGLPIPFEPTFAIAGNWLVVGATPSASLAATQSVMAAKSGGGLAANPNFAKNKWKTPDPTGIVFVDSARTMRSSYPLLTFATSAIANAMRSSSSEVPAREVGFILPTYAELAKDARPFISMTYWDGHDMVMDSQYDRSVLVNIAGLLGIGDLGQIIASGMLGGGIGVGIAEEMQGSRSRQYLEEQYDDDDDDMDDDGEDDDAEPKRARPN